MYNCTTKGYLWEGIGIDLFPTIFFLLNIFLWTSAILLYIIVLVILYSLTAKMALGNDLKISFCKPFLNDHNKYCLQQFLLPLTSFPHNSLHCSFVFFPSPTTSIMSLKINNFLLTINYVRIISDATFFSNI